MISFADSPEPRRDLAECGFVGAIWLVMSIAALLLVYLFGSVVPYFDDWGTAPVLCGDEPLTWGWLWRAENEHRIPAAKVVMWALCRLTGGDLRSVMYFSVAIASAAALGLSILARRLRGSMSYTDAFFPLLLLHGGHAESFLWCSQACQMIPVCLFLALVMLLASEKGCPRQPGDCPDFRAGDCPDFRAVKMGLSPSGLLSVLALAGCVLLLPLNGGTGMAFGLASTTAVGLVGFTEVRQPSAGGKLKGIALLTAATLAAGLMAWYVLNYQRVPCHVSQQSGIADAAAAALRSAGMALGVVGYLSGCISGAAVLGLSLVSAWFLLRVYVRRPGERHRVLRLALAMAGAWTLALMIGVGRAKFGGAAMRYIFLTAPILCCVYLICLLYASRALGGLVQVSLFTAMCALSTYHAKLALDLGAARAQATRRFVEDVGSGIPASGIVGRHWFQWHVSEPWMIPSLEALRQAGTGIFGQIRPDPPFQAIRLFPSPDAEVAASAESDSAHRGETREWDFTLHQPRFVYAVRVRFSLKDDGRDARFEVLWADRGAGDFSPDRAARFDYPVRTGPEPVTHTVWIGEAIARVRLRMGTASFRTLPAERDVFRIPAPSGPTRIELEAVEVLARPAS